MRWRRTTLLSAVCDCPDRRSPSSCVDMFLMFQVPSQEKIQVAAQSVAARLSLSASHVCTWALLMQEDCLAMWTLQPGTTGSLPVAPEDGLRGCGVAQARMLPISTVGLADRYSAVGWEYPFACERRVDAVVISALHTMCDQL